jgi:hypothetical protein
MVKIPTNAWDTASQSIISNDDSELLQAEEELDNAVHALKVLSQHTVGLRYRTDS